MTKITNWGNYPVVDANVIMFDQSVELQKKLASHRHVIARGLGRCYGDSSLAPTIISTERYNKFLDFDEQTGIVTCQSGVSLEDVLRVFVPRGWFLPVTPGTKYVSIGGAIAADVHGKNHHKEGTFGDHVVWMDVLLPSGEIARCSPAERKELFDATCGGMGLTGVILRVAFKLKPIETAYIREEIIAAPNLDAIMELYERSAMWTYTVAWIDCLSKGKKMGRSILMRGEHATKNELHGSKDLLGFRPRVKMTVPFMMPSFLLNTCTVKIFNAVYYHNAARKKSTHMIDYDKFFYPLDSINHWNRIYGKKGFTQYQVAFPIKSSREGLAALLGAISESGLGSFLAVLKLFGPQKRILSFPEEGYTLALDFPLNEKVLSLLAKLDEIVLKYGGRLYLAKDVRMNAEMFRQGYPETDAFRQLQQQWDPTGKFGSLQSKRVGLTS